MAACKTTHDMPYKKKQPYTNRQGKTNKNQLSTHGAT